MTPRTVTLAFDHGWTLRQVLDETKILRFGRMLKARINRPIIWICLEVGHLNGCFNGRVG